MSLTTFSASVESSLPSYTELKDQIWETIEMKIGKIRSQFESSEVQEKLRIIVLGTGGTFQSAKTDKGTMPTGSLEESFIALNLPKETDVELALFDVMNFDSAKMSIEQWRVMAEVVVEMITKLPHLCDGFIITHGTDTMADAASNLAYMLRGLRVPVIFTGSQTPARMKGTDAKVNMERCLKALKIAKNEEIAEVMVLCGDELARATWVKKAGDTTVNAFRSWNTPTEMPNLHEIVRGGDISHIQPALIHFGTGIPEGKLTFSPHANKIDMSVPFAPFTDIYSPSNIIPVRLTDISPTILAEFIVATKVTVVELLGSATANPDLVEVILHASKSGKAIILKAPFYDSTANLGDYEAGSKLAASGLPIVNTSASSLNAKVNYSLYYTGVRGRNKSGYGTVFSPLELQRFYNYMVANLVGELV